MSKENFKKFIRRAQDLRLSENEKDSLRSKIWEFISFNPIRGKAPIVRERNYISIFEVRHFMKAASLVLIVAVVVGGSGISYAASSALPGETLYSVKVNINENIEETLATTAKAKLAVQSEHIQRRLDEVQTLRKDGKLSSGAQKIVIAKLEEHTEEASKSIDVLREKGDVSSVLEATSSLTPIFEANKEILEKENVKKETANDPSDTTDETKVLIAKIDDSNKVFQEQENSVIASVEADEEPTTATMAMMATTEDTQTDPVSLAAKEADKATDKAAKEVREISRQIGDIVEERIDSAKDKITDIKYAIAKEEALAEEKLKAELKTLEAEIKIEAEIKPVPTTTDPALPTNIKISDLSLTKETVESDISATITIPDVQKSPEVETSPVVIEPTDSFDIKAKIKYAEDLIKEAESLLRAKRFKDALMKAQEVNHIAGEIETHRRLEALDLAKKQSNEATLKATVVESTKSN